MKAESITATDVVSTVSLEPKNTALVVLGMHRSGTSAITRVLNMMGCDLPLTLLAANESNEKGHWESSKFRDLNNDILESAGSNWQDWAEFNPDWYSSPKYSDYKQRLISTIEAEYPERGLVVVKDPRVCKILPVWTDALEAMDVRPVCILSLRHPVEVATSLQKRNNIQLANGLLIWLRYVLDAEYASRSLARTIVGYDKLLKNWAECVEQIAAELDVTFPKTIGKAAPHVGQFLNSKLRHHSDLQRPDIVAFGKNSWTAQVWRIFERWLTDGEQKKDYEELDKIRASVNECQPVFEQIVSISQRDHSTQMKLADLEEHQKQTSNKLIDARELAQRIEKQLDSERLEHEADLSALSETVRVQNEELQTQSDQLSKQSEVIKGLEDAQKVLSDEHETQTSTYLIAQAELHSTKEELVNLQDAYADVLEKLDSATRQTKLSEDRLLKLKETTDLELNLRSDALEQASTSYSVLSKAHEELTVANEEIKNELRLLGDAARAERAHMKRRMEDNNARYSGKIDDLKLNLSTLTEKEAGQARKIEGLNRKLSALQNKEAGSRLKVEELSAKISQRDRRVTDLVGRLDDSKARITRLTSLANKRDQKISEQDQLVKSLLRKVSGLEHVSDELSTLVAQLLKTFFANRDLPVIHNRRVRNFATFIQAVGIFDADWYAERNPDIDTSKLDPAEHFVRYGAREGRAPSARFLK